MKKTGLEIVEMIAKGKAPKKIKQRCYIYTFKPNYNYYEHEYGEEFNILNNLNDEFEIIEEEPKVWKPKEDEEYYTIDSGYCIISNFKNECCKRDCGRYEIGNCFKTKAEAEKMLEKIKIYMRLKRYALEHNIEKINWNNREQQKWYIDFYDIDCNKLIISWTQCAKFIPHIYFTSEELCQQAIEEIGEENIKKLFED